MHRKLVFLSAVVLLAAGESVARFDPAIAPGAAPTLFGSYSVNLIKGDHGDLVRYEVVALHAVLPLTAWRMGNGSEIEVSAEFFAGQVVRPESDTEIGLPLLIRYWAPPWNALRADAYVEAGAGPAYFSRAFREQSTRFNFADFGGAGLCWKLTRVLTLRTGYRIRHVSNGGIELPNHGVNGHMALIGLSLLR